MDNRAAIHISNANFGYTKHKTSVDILKNITLKFGKGEFIGVAGLNGSGKSTLLRSVCGLLPLLKGDVSINGISLSELSASELAKQASIVLTEKISGFNLNCYDAVAAGQMPYTNIFNALEPEHKKIINSAIEACGLLLHQNKLLTELSDGLFQKTMIAKCIAQQTPVMLLDEPSAFLDYASKHELFLLLKSLAEKDNKCILVSSHDLDLVLKYCHKVLLVKNSTAELIPIEEARWHTVFKELSGGYL